MSIRQSVFMVFLISLVFQSNVFADKIYLKSGKILDGKIMDRREYYNPARSYCEDFNDTVVWDNGTYRCIPKDEIQKVEKEFKKPEGLALLAKDDRWAAPQNGYITQMIPQSNEYIVGKPMKFGLVLKNVSDSLKWYDHQAITHDVLIIKDADGNEPYYKVGPFQTLGAERPIDTGEIVPLFEARNITDEYVIMKSGKYTIQFRGGNYGMAIDSNFPKSNIVEFEIKPGTPSKSDLLISSLAKVLPDERWQVATGNKFKGVPAGRKEVNGFSVILVRYAGLIRDTIIITLWQTEAKTGIIEKEPTAQISEYLGKNDSGHFYIAIPPKALDFWPTIKDDIAETLKIQKR